MSEAVFTQNKILDQGNLAFRAQKLLTRHADANFVIMRSFTRRFCLRQRFIPHCLSQGNISLDRLQFLPRCVAFLEKAFAFDLCLRQFSLKRDQRLDAGQRFVSRSLNL